MITWDMLKGIFKKAKTKKYPLAPDEAPEGHRGWLEHDRPKCVNCGMCARVCPSGAVVMVEGKEGKKIPKFDLGRCTFCGQCSEVCPTKCITMTNDYEKASTNTQDFKLD